MNNPGIQNNQFAKVPVQQQIQQAQQAAGQQQPGSNSPLMMSHGGGIASTVQVQTQHMGQVASYFNVNPNTVQIGQPSDQARAAMAYELLLRIIRGEAAAPTEKLRELTALYEYLKKYLQDEDDEEENEKERKEEFKGLYDILNWFRRSRAFYGRPRSELLK